MSRDEEIWDLAQTISNDNDGLWLGDSEYDDIGHIASYIGKLEAAVDELRQQLLIEHAHCEALHGEVRK